MFSLIYLIVIIAASFLLHTLQCRSVISLKFQLFLLVRIVPPDTIIAWLSILTKCFTICRYKYRELHPNQDVPGIIAYADDVQVTQPKRIRLDLSLSAPRATPVPPPLVSALEEAYSDLYLTKPGSLRASYKSGTRPPRKDSIVKLAGALAQLPACDQLKRVDCVREHGVNVISLTEVEDDFVPTGSIISLQD
jgi:hypothetical protein